MYECLLGIPGSIILVGCVTIKKKISVRLLLTFLCAAISGYCCGGPTKGGGYIPTNLYTLHGQILYITSTVGLYMLEIPWHRVIMWFKKKYNNDNKLK